MLEDLELDVALAQIKLNHVRIHLERAKLKMNEIEVVYPTKPCMYCGRPVTCNQPNCQLVGHVCPWNGSYKSDVGLGYDCRIWIAMIKSNVPCYKHLEYYSRYREWPMWSEWE